MQIPLAATLALLLAACQAPALAPAPAASGAAAPAADAPLVAARSLPSARTQLDVPVTRRPYEQVGANWKHRLDQPYVYVEHLGDYRRIGSAIGELLDSASAQEIAADGPLFVLFFDDPGDTPVVALHARACLPVSPGVSPRGLLRFDVLPSTPVAYAVVGGPYPDVPLSYSGLLAFLRERGWEVSGPIRHVYLNPEGVAQGEEPLTEVQVPWVSTR